MWNFFAEFSNIGMKADPVHFLQRLVGNVKGKVRLCDRKEVYHPCA